ncbi:MAG TPA: hypothetical protein VFF65_02095 [Phycisphaerales bacterium]|nr:hypothetical protein [Phycisphaerales bacterium]
MATATPDAPAPARPRFALLQFGNADGTPRTMDYAALGLAPATLVTEGKARDPKDHIKRFAEAARSLPKGSLLAANCEYYGDKNVSIACELMNAGRKANPSLELTAYCPEQTLSKLAANGWDPKGRAASAMTAANTARALKDAGATHASIDAYAYLDDGDRGIKDYLSTDWYDAWGNQVGQAAAVVETILPPVLWISPRFHTNGRTIAFDPAKPRENLEPYVPSDVFMRMYLFGEQRGWRSISLCGWSHELKKRTDRGFAPLTDRDLQDLHGLKNTPFHLA